MEDISYEKWTLLYNLYSLCQRAIVRGSILRLQVLDRHVLSQVSFCYHELFQPIREIDHVILCESLLHYDQRDAANALKRF